MSSFNLEAFSSLRPTKILFYLRAMKSMGFGADEVLSGTNLTLKKLTNPHFLVETHQYVRVVSNMMRLTKEPGLAFKLVRLLKPGDLGILGHAISAARDAAVAVEVWRKYGWLFFGGFFLATGHRRDGLIWYEYTQRARLQPHLLRFFIEEKIAIEAKLFQEFNVVKIPSRYLSVTYEKPRHWRLYEETLGIPVVFAADRISFALDASYNTEFPTADAETFNLLVNYLEEMTFAVVMQKNFATKTRYLITENLPRILSVDEIAARFGMSKRTFCRNLQLENSSYQQLLAEVREELTKNYLVTSDLKTKEIAALLGFGDTGSLRRAFRSWTGISIGEYQRQFVMAP